MENAPDGTSAKERMLAQLAAKMPWCYALDDSERACLLTLLRKMLDTPCPVAGTAAAAGEPAGEQEQDLHPWLPGGD